MSTTASNLGLVCGNCGYDLRGIDSERCPECGRRFDPAKLLDEHVPWEQRRFIGRVRGFLRTLRMVLFAPRRAAAVVMEHPADLRSARLFQWITTVFALAGLVLILLNVGRFLPWQGWEARSDLGWSQERYLSDLPAMMLVPGWALGITLAGLLLGGLLIPRLAGLFFRPRGLTLSQQNRSAAAACYTSAPLALLPPLVVLAWISTGHEIWRPGYYDYTLLEQLFYGAIYLLLRASYYLVPVLFAAWWVNTLIMLKHCTACGPGRIVAAAVLLPLLWLGVPLLLIVGLHLIAGFLALVHLSFSF